jgi:hypothetical protein
MLSCLSSARYILTLHYQPVRPLSQASSFWLMPITYGSDWSFAPEMVVILFDQEHHTYSLADEQRAAARQNR